MLKQPTTILITGASQGIGYALALQLAAQGHTVLAWARDAQRLAALAAQVTSASGQANIHTTVVDLADTGALSAHVAALLAQHPALSGVIHNAAIQIEHALGSPDYEPALVQQEIAINLTAPIVLTQLLLPHLQRQPCAFVCNISSVLALASKRSSAVYCATKAGLHGFSDSLRAQLAGTAVKVFEIMPPTVDTQMTAHRSVPKMSAATVAALTVRAIRRERALTLLGTAKLLGVLLWLAPPVAKRMMLRF